MRFASACPSRERSAECRPMTDSDRLRARPSMMSSVMPSASSASRGSPPRFRNGRTAIAGRWSSSRGRAGCASATCAAASAAPSAACPFDETEVRGPQPDVADQPIAPAPNGLDEAGCRGIVMQDTAQLADELLDLALLHVGTRPHGLEERLLRHELAAALGQAAQHGEGLGGQGDLLVAPPEALVPQIETQRRDARRDVRDDPLHLSSPPGHYLRDQITTEIPP